MDNTRADTPQAAQALIAPLAAIGVFLPSLAGSLLGLALLISTLWRWPQVRAEAWCTPAAGTVMFSTWLAFTALWSELPMSQWPTQWAHYAVILLAVPVLATGVPAGVARRALHCFVLAALFLAVLQLGYRAWPVITPDSVIRSLVHSIGNKSICNGVLLALATVLMLDIGAGACGSLWVRASGFAAACLMGAVLIGTSASRSAMALLGLLVAVWLLLRVRRAWPWLLFALGALLVAGWVFSGRSGLAGREQAELLQLSNQQRMQLYRETLAMVQERPLVGHGLGSWPALWQQRNHDPAMSTFNTAHSEPLQVAQQSGAIGLLLLLAAVWPWWRQAWRARSSAAGRVAVLTLLAWGTTALVHAALRDLSFAVPLSVIAGLALAGTNERRPLKQKG